MSEETTKTTEQTDVPVTTPATDNTSTTEDKKSFGDRGKRGSFKPGQNRRPRGGRRPERPKSEFAQKIISIRRVTRVVAGGRRFSFSVAMVIGDKKGSVGVGIGKAGDTSLAIQKAFNNAKRNMVTLALDDKHSIKHEVSAKYNSARVMLFPNYGRGVVAGSAVRSIIELAGIKDVTAKVLSRSKNQINIARAAVKALGGSFGSIYKKKEASQQTEGEDTKQENQLTANS